MLCKKSSTFQELVPHKINEILGDISHGDQFSEDDNENIPTTASGNTTIIYDPGQYVKSPSEEENPEGKKSIKFTRKIFI